MSDGHLQNCLGGAGAFFLVVARCVSLTKVERVAEDAQAGRGHHAESCPFPHACRRSVPVKIDSGDCVGVVVLMGQRPEPVNESKLQSVVALCTSAAPFLEHMNTKSENQPPNNSSSPDVGGARRDSATSIASNAGIPADLEKARLSRLTIKYPPPQRGQFRSLGSDSGNPGATPLKLATQSGDRSNKASGAADPRGRQRGSATNYMTQLITALQKCKEHEVRSLNPKP